MVYPESRDCEIRLFVKGQAMPADTAPQSAPRTSTVCKQAMLVASGDSRLPANQECWPAQEAVEGRLAEAFMREGVELIRAHHYDENLKHGFICSQRMGMDVFGGIPAEAPLIVAVAAWQYSHHVLAGLRDHRGPILTVANWSGQWPGLVGLLNLNSCLTKAGVPHSTTWSKDFLDDSFLRGIREWIGQGRISHDTSHVHDMDPSSPISSAAALGRDLARDLRRRKAILGVFDEGCMGMYNAIVEDHLLNELGVYKERLSQSSLFAAMQLVSAQDARQAREWLSERSMRFVTGTNEETELTENQILGQLKMYIAAMRMADEFGCDAIGIQYQQGLKDLAPASDLAEGLLNNVERPPVFRQGTGEELFAGRALPHFNEVDECAGLDALITNRVCMALDLDPATTLHDIRWGEWYVGDGIDDFVWVFMISGAAPASHFVGGYAGAASERQPAMYFPRGGGTLKGVCRPGPVVWSRVFIEGGALHFDVGRATVVGLPQAETERRLQLTTPQWPIMHAVLHGVSRDQMMARHRANHISVVYAPSEEMADRVLAAKAAMFAELGVRVHLCGLTGARV